MTSTIIPFISSAECTSRENLAAFIEHSRQQRFFRGEHAIDWSSNTWDFRPFVSTRGQNPIGWVIHFTTHDSTRRGNKSPTSCDFTQPFLDVAKALITEFLVSTAMAHVTHFLTVVRLIEKAFVDLGIVADICNLTPIILDKAAETIQATYAEKWTYGRALERLALNIVNPARLSTSHILWKSPFKYAGAKRNDRVNREGGAGEGADRLPHIKSIIDLAGVFHNSKYVPDIVITAWFALAMFAPDRANEILTLPSKCGTEMDGIFGIDWRALKGGAAMTKFATTDDWADVAREAIRRLLDLGAKCRVAAKWYVKNPGKLYLPPGWEHLRGQPLTLWEVQQIIGKESPLPQGHNVRAGLKRTGQVTRDPCKVGIRKGAEHKSSWSALFTFESAELSIISRLPDSFPYADKKHGLEIGDALFCLPASILRGDGDTLEYIPDLISYSQIHHELGAKPHGRTIFQRHDLRNPETNEVWKLNTHQPRHLLNTLAQSKHLSQALIAFWSGRKSINQNAWYDHIPQEAFIEAFVRMGENAPREIRVVGPLDNKVIERAHKEMITHDDALRLELGSIITTRFGICRHNFSLTPCPKDKNCIGCGENTFLQGDTKQIEEAIKQKAISDHAVAASLRAKEDDEPGVERWLKKHQEAAERWGMALAYMTDPTIPAGTLITLPPPGTSQTKAGLSIAIRKVPSAGHSRRRQVSTVPLMRGVDKI